MSMAASEHSRAAGGGGDSAPPMLGLRRFSSLYQQSMTAVYIKDDAYAWLPAQVTSTESLQEDGQVTVSITLPQNWHQSTVLSRESNIEDVEDALLGGEEPNTTRIVSLEDYENSELPLQNVDSTTQQLLGKRDMADLPFLHEAAILYNLKERHANLQPYTRVGDIVVAMNPFMWIDGLYTQETRTLYAKNLIWEEKEEQEEDNNDFSTFGNLYDKLGFDPHVYETSSLAYKGLASTGENQTILVSGESGAGKTETVKILMESLATIELTRPNEHVEDQHKEFGSTISAAETTKRVLESNPVFEAFGNAKTIRNDNSSRFGKFTQLQFDVEPLEDASQANREVPLCLLAGSKCTTYLLEKSRVVSHSQGERTYHVFYQLLAASDEYKSSIWDELVGSTTENFSYLGFTETDAIDGVSDEEQWPRTLEALKVFTLEGDSLVTLMRALCIVLQLGNLTFDHDPDRDFEEGGTVISSKEELEKLSTLSGIPPEAIEAAMTKRVIKTAYDEVNVQLRPNVAKDSCDALAKEIYSRVFEYLVVKINEYTSAERHHLPTKKEFGLISLLDIFGFERFKVNRFEQLCINYANERLQQKYVLDNFRQVQQEYIAEGIEIFDFAVVDNSKVLDLLEGRIGLIISLNEECVRPKGNDESYVYKIKVVHKEHERLIDEKLHAKAEFGIHHFAGKVTYNATKFVERNTDKLPEDLLQCAAQSTNALIKKEFEGVIEMHKQNQAASVVQRKRTNKTVLEKFRLQLKHLMAQMENTATRYIRCIKPNPTMTPKLTDHYVTMHQLECAGLVTAITISRESFPNKLAYDTVKERFGLLLTPAEHKYITGMTDKDAVDHMLSKLLLSLAEEEPDGRIRLPYACGNTRVYFRAGALELLETKRLDYYTRFVVRVQRWIRAIQARVKYEETRTRIVELQAWARARNEWSRYKSHKSAAITLQSAARTVAAKRRSQGIRCSLAATVLQKAWRRQSTKKVTDFKSAATVIQRFVRNRRQKNTFTAKLAIVVEEAKMDDKLMYLQKQVHGQGAGLPRSNANMKGRAVEDHLLGEIETMFDYLRKEIYRLRAKNGELKQQVRDVEQEKREYMTHVENAESAASVSRLQVARLTKENASLLTEVINHKAEAASLRKEVRSASVSCEESVSTLKLDYEDMIAERDKELKLLKRTIKREHRECKVEKELLRAQITKLEETQSTEVIRLKDELRRTQDSHHDYLAKLMDVLETTHAARESETARITKELQSVKEEKDSEILHLQREIAQLREMNRDEAMEMASTLSSKEEEMSAMRHELERNSEARRQRGEKYNEVSSKLESALRKSSVDPNVGDKMRNMIHLLGNLYALEEGSQAKINQDTVQMLDDFVVATEPDKVVDDLRQKVKDLEMTTLKLRYELQEQNTCQRCERRDQRRREQQRRGEQQKQASRKNLRRHSSGRGG